MITPGPAQERVTEFIDRRREPRDSQPAPVKVAMEQDGGCVEFDAVMVDSSTGGLAIRHWRRELTMGRQIRISVPGRGQFVAQVVWNWSVGPVVISGLEKVQPGTLLSIGTRCRTPEQGLPGAKTSWRWVFAACAVLLIAAGWYLTTRFW